ncbi:MAG: glycoside hydrolase family 43 protein [Prevotella sp.]|nr:glycoside hydrolase family 43 protein [Prevotella sp.]
MRKYLFCLLTALFAVSAAAYELKRVSVHDPSIVWEPTSKTYYIFGSHRACAKTTDLMSWTEFSSPWQTSASNNAPNSTAFTTPAVKKVKKGGAEVDFPAFNAINWSARGSASYSVDGNMWAPDVIWNPSMKKWCQYLSINGDNWYSSIILLTSDNIEGPYLYQGPVVISGFYDGTSYKDTDLELVLGSLSALPDRYATGDKWGDRYPNNIDPCVFYDEKGKLWMSYGSWSGGIWMLELDESTGLRDYDVTYELTGSGNGITVDPYFGKKIAGGYYVSGEASYIEYIGGYYFLFMSYGFLSDDGGYQMRVFRSENPDGPYEDARSTSAIFQSYKMNYGSTANDNRGVNIFGAYGEWGNQTKGNYSERAQGHNSILAADDGRTYLVYHTRFQNSRSIWGWDNAHQVRVHQVFQNEDGWLVAAPFEYTGETVKSADIAASQQVPTAQIAGSYKLLVHPFKLDHTKMELAKPVDIQLNADGTVTGDQTGSWAIKEGTSYISITLDREYKGVLVYQTLEPTNDQAIAFTCMNRNGVTIWGYKPVEASGISDTKAALQQDDRIYDLNGRLVTTPLRKGIYIRNGKKIVR